MTLFDTRASAVNTHAGGSCVEGFDVHARCASLMSLATIDGPSVGSGQVSHTGAAGAETTGAGAGGVAAGFEAQAATAASEKAATATRASASGVKRGEEFCIPKDGTLAGWARVTHAASRRRSRSRFLTTAARLGGKSPPTRLARIVVPIDVLEAERTRA